MMSSNVKKVFAFILALSMVFTMSAAVFAADEAAPAEPAEPTAEAVEAVEPEASADTALTEGDVTDEAANAISEVLGTTEEVTKLPDLTLEFASDYRFVNALGIFEFLDDNFYQTEQVTRAQFATVIAKLIKAQTEGYPLYSQSPFADIDSNHFAYPAVCFLTDIGIINGDGNSTFRPDDAITAAEATKMTMCALGYKEAAENYAGGYPMGYVSYAQIYGVYDGLKLGQADTLSALKVGKLIKNALKAEILEGVVYTNGGVEYLFTDKTMMSETYKITQEYGVVNGTYYAYVNGDEINDEDEVEIGGTVYEFQKGLDPEKYLGQVVDYYYMEEVEGYDRDVIIYMEPRAGKNSMVTVNAQDIYSFEDDEITYADAKTNREKKVKITENTVVSLNGQPYYTYGESDLKLKEGNMTIISHASNLAVADVVIINEFYDGIVERVAKSSKQVIFKNNTSASSALSLPTLVLDDEDTTYRARLTLGENDIKADDLVKGDVITYTVSKDGRYIRGYVSRDEVFDTVTEIRTENTASGEVTKIKIDGVEYYISKYCTAKISAGTTLDFVISFDGRIVGTKGASANGGNYGYLIAADVTDGAIVTSTKFKLFTSDGELKIIDGADRIKTNIDANGVGVIKSYKPTEFAKMVGASFNDPKLVVYETNSAGQLKTIYLPANYTSTYSPYDELGFGMYYANSSARLQNNLIASCMIDENTVIFRVPFTDRDRDTDYKVSSREELANGTYNVEIYDIDRGIAGVLVIKDKEPNSLTETAGVMVINELVQSYDAASGDILTQINGFAGGKEVNFVIDEDVTLAQNYAITLQNDIHDLAKGDVIQYSVGSNGYISKYRVLFDCSERDKTSYFENDETGKYYEVMPSVDFYEIYGEVIDVFDLYITASSRVAGKLFREHATKAESTASTASQIDEIKYKRAYPTGSANLYEYNINKDELTICDPYEIEEGSKAFIHTRKIDEIVDILVVTEK